MFHRVTLPRKWGPYFLSFTRVNSKWIGDPDVKHETIQMSGGNLGAFIYILGVREVQDSNSVCKTPVTPDYRSDMRHTLANEN